jgi:hypothetical protein
MLSNCFHNSALALLLHIFFYQQVKLCSPDYKEQDPEEAVKDFQMRIKNYEIRYETLDHVEDKWVIACFLMKFEYSNNY